MLQAYIFRSYGTYIWKEPTKIRTVKYCKTPTGHPKGHPCCKIADYDDTAFGAGTLTVHPWRAGPDCGKFIYNFW